MSVFEIRDDKQNCTRTVLFLNKVLLRWFRSSLLLERVDELRRAQQIFFSLSDAKNNEAQGFLRDLQQCQLSILKGFDSFAKKNQVMYWIDFGTLIGAARSGKFIPWDDDIDVSAPRESYDKLWKLRENLPKGFVLEYAKDKRALKLRHENLPDWITMDIFPVDFISNDYSVLESVKLSGKIHDLQRRAKRTAFMNVAKIKKELGEGVLSEVGTLNESKMICYGLEFRHLSHPSIIIPNKVIFPLKQIEFEGGAFPAPRDHDRFLIYLYKNWRQVDCSQKAHVSIHNISVADLLRIRDFLETRSDKGFASEGYLPRESLHDN